MQFKVKLTELQEEICREYLWRINRKCIEKKWLINDGHLLLEDRESSELVFMLLIKAIRDRYTSSDPFKKEHPTGTISMLRNKVRAMEPDMELDRVTQRRKSWLPCECPEKAGGSTYKVVADNIVWCFECKQHYDLNDSLFGSPFEPVSSP